MRTKIIWFVAGMGLALLLLVAIYQIPFVRFHLEWRMDAAAAIARGLVYPQDTLPTPIGENPDEPAETIVPPTIPIRPTHTMPPNPTPTATPPPVSVSLPAPEWEKQDWNNCGPATLALGLRYHGWDGDQFDISELLKPDRGDRNVNIDELVYFVRNRAGWMDADYRVGGTLEILKRFLAAGYPVIVEKGYIVQSDGPDAGWAGHYLLLTGYDDEAQLFTGQDSFLGPDRTISYQDLDEGWKAFNRAYMYFYPNQSPPPLEQILGVHLDADQNREEALAVAREEVAADPEDPYAWFNLGTNLLYFEDYREAAEAYDQALDIGLPWRFTRYQFGPYIAYFNMGRQEDVIQLADATLRRTSKAEESMLWRGWAKYRMGDVIGAIEDFRAALEINHPYYLDAQYALSYLGAQ
jgi:tetratricopeptide (TPR) repeat protein